MNLTVKQKLFLILASTALLSVLAITLAMNWRFNIAFNQYQAERALDNLSIIEHKVIQYYQQHGSLVGLETRPRILGRWLDAKNEAVRPMSGNEVRQPQVEGKAPHEVHFLLRSLSILDAQQQVVIAAKERGDYIAKKAIELNGETIAWMALTKPERLSSMMEKRFFNSLFFAWVVTFIVIALFIVAIATLFTRQFSKPIEQLASTIKHLTEGRYAQRSNVGSNDELGYLSDHLNKLAATLEKNELLRQEWTANTAHELRTPITVLRGEIEAMQEGIRPVNADNLQSLNDEIRHLERLIEDLNSLSMADLGSLSYSLSDVDLNRELAICAELAERRLDQKQIEIHTQLDELPNIQADQTRLHQLIGNLLENSQRYTDAGGSIYIKTKRMDKNIILTIEDTPPVPKPEEMARLFEKFYRVELSRNRHSGGSGLGLSICKKIAEAHGWNIEAYASEQGGLGIRLTIPVS